MKFELDLEVNFEVVLNSNFYPKHNSIFNWMNSCNSNWIVSQNPCRYLIFLWSSNFLIELLELICIFSIQSYPAISFVGKEYYKIFDEFSYKTRIFLCFKSTNTYSLANMWKTRRLLLSWTKQNQHHKQELWQLSRFANYTYRFYFFISYVKLKFRFKHISLDTFPFLYDRQIKIGFV